MSSPFDTRADQGAAAPTRRLRRELLDDLPSSDPHAIRSRRDLRRVNAWMRNGPILCRLLQRVSNSATPPRSIAELGGGDGHFMLGIAQRMAIQWPHVTVEIIDRQSLIAPDTIRAFEELGWTLRATERDVFAWAKQCQAVDLIISNLFLHHFKEDQLRVLFQELAARTTAWVACEPRRFRFARLSGWLVGLIGGNAVTRHDAVASVEAGFRGRELSALWPDRPGWRLEESEAGCFSHQFAAWRAWP